jgi:hypothetical protein
MDTPRFNKPTANIIPGFGQEILIAEYDWVATWAIPVGPFTNYGDDSIIAADHTFATGKGFQKAYLSNRDSELLGSYMGAQDSRAFKPELNAFMPSINPQTTTFFAGNKRYLVLLPSPDCAGTRYIQIGTQCRGAEIPAASVKMKSGKAESNDPVGHEFIIDGYADKCYWYDGTVTLFP